MKILKNILIFFIAIAVFLSSNGFILEQYLCFSCESEHKELAFFEFGELKHEHEPCEGCLSHGHICDCSQNGESHEKNTEIKYYSLDVLYVGHIKSELKQVITIELDKDYGFDAFQFLNQSILDNKIVAICKLLKIPPLIKQFENSLNFCSTFSIFRL